MSRLVRACVLVALAFAGAGSLAATPAPAASAASTPPGDAARLVRDRLKLSPVLKGEFEQTKTLKGFRNALVSRGEFLVARGQGVWWHTREPFETTLVVTRTRLFTRNTDGSITNLADAQAEPGVRQVNELIFSLLAADLDALADKFNIATQPAGAAGWSLVLTPRDPAVARFLVRATLAGERDVQSVRIEEARGDTTQVRFSHQQPAAALAPDEAARFQ
ncbi:MAG: outer membrane lipoprotein carrier protein LolA [Burkholderiaceae bacterium]